MKKILLNILTHGDETAGLRVSEAIDRRYSSLIGNGLDIQIANEKAYKMGRRYLEDDLNRVFPGKVDGSHEQRLAFELAPKISSYEVVIDVHATESGMEDAIIITKIDEHTLSLVKKIEPKHVLFMSMRPDTSLISSARVGIAFEMGRNNDLQTVEKTVCGVERILSVHGLIDDTKPSYGFKTDFYRVTGDVPKPSGALLVPRVTNFRLIKKGEIYARVLDGMPIVATEDFYPVLFGSTNYQTIFGFSAQKMDW